MTKDKTFNWKCCLCCGIFIWFVVNLLQGIFTEIQEDEAYYALFGEHLAWGYYDHPPMVALMTHFSSQLFSGILGARFFTIIASCLSLFVLWKLLDERQPDAKKVFLFFTLACSVVMFNIYGFVTTPDASLILFSALFLLVYQHYLEEKSWKNVLLMGVFMAGMIYSKYHAFLLLGLIVLSNLKLLKDGKFYVACLMALALLIPHILWQVHADFPSFRYHLSGRSEPFQWSYFWEYLPNQLLIFNPFTFGAVVYVLIKYRDSQSPEKANRIDADGATPAERQIFERGLRFILIGFFFFFWLMAFRGHVEPHWTIVCVIPVVVLAYRKTLIDYKLRKFTKRFILPSLLLVLAFRILLLTPLADRFGYHGKEAYYQAIEQVADDSPVVFRGSFQRPALYHYFTGKPCSTLCCYYDRKTQYDFWQFDKDWTGKKVFVCGAEGNISQTYKVENVQFDGYLTEHFQTANRLETHFKLANISENAMPVFHHGDTISLDFSIHNHYNQAIDFHHKEFDMCLKLLLLSSNKALYGYYNDIRLLQPHSTYKGQFFTIIGENIAKGRNLITLGISDRIATFTTDGNEIEIFIED